MPMPISLAHRLAHRLAEARRAEVVPYLRPDGKTQVTVRYESGRPIEIEKILISTQPRPGVDPETLIKPDLGEHVVRPILPSELFDERKLLDEFLVNPTGKFEIGGPMGDCGLTGRKVIVDTYGGAARPGGGCFSGKDPPQGGPPAGHAARPAAQKGVAAGLADTCEGQGAHAVGRAPPSSLPGGKRAEPDLPRGRSAGPLEGGLVAETGRRGRVSRAIHPLDDLVGVGDTREHEVVVVAGGGVEVDVAHLEQALDHGLVVVHVLNA